MDTSDKAALYIDFFMEENRDFSGKHGPRFEPVRT